MLAVTCPSLRTPPAVERPRSLSDERHFRQSSSPGYTVRLPGLPRHVSRIPGVHLPGGLDDCLLRAFLKCLEWGASERRRRAQTDWVISVDPLITALGRHLDVVNVKAGTKQLCEVSRFTSGADGFVLHQRARPPKIRVQFWVPPRQPSRM